MSKNPLTNTFLGAIIQNTGIFKKILYHIILIMWFFYSAKQQTQFIYLTAMNFAAFHCIYPRCVHT